MTEPPGHMPRIKVGGACESGPCHPAPPWSAPQDPSLGAHRGDPFPDPNLGSHAANGPHLGAQRGHPHCAMTLKDGEGFPGERGVSVVIPAPKGTPPPLNGTNLGHCQPHFALPVLPWRAGRRGEGGALRATPPLGSPSHHSPQLA